MGLKMASLRSTYSTMLILLFLILVVAEDTGLPRLDSSITSALSQPSSSSSSSNSEASTISTSVTSSSSFEPITSSSPSASLSSSLLITSATVSPTAAPIPSSLAAIFNSTLTPDELPLTPEITPAFGVAGILLILSGAIYALVGIRLRLLHTYLSAAYLSSLSVTVLIIYVMMPPVSDGLEGAYLVAIVMTGLFVGAGAVIFKDITEGLGCLLGGFCLSMWFLVLQPGGLLRGSGPVAGFISAFSAVSFASSLSHVTRTYGLIASQSFGGGTAIVLGIDCFSRAGLKEFWVYIWNLNGNIFPLGATTYPLTKGMKVEIAAIVVIFLTGLVSQSRLWAVIKERRARREAQRLEDAEDLEREEAAVGRRINYMNAIARNQWEVVYGDKNAINPSSDSGVGSVRSIRKEAESVITSMPLSPPENIELTDISDVPVRNNTCTEHGMKQPPAAITVTADHEQEETSKIDKETSQADHLNFVQEAPVSNIKPDEPASKEEDTITDQSQPQDPEHISRHSSRRTSSVLKAFVLPFQIPNERNGDNQSTKGTIADDEERRFKRLSIDTELRRNSSNRSQASKRLSRLTNSFSISNEHLVARQHGERTSVAATIDDLSEFEDLQSLSKISTGIQSLQDNLEVLESSSVTKVSEVSPNESQMTAPQDIESKNSELEEAQPADDDARSKADKSSKGQSDMEAALSIVLTKDILPAIEPPVARVYRTNEWAKHLSKAEMPSVEDPALNHAECEDGEVPVRVDVMDLQRSAQAGKEQPARPDPQQSSKAPFDVQLNEAYLSQAVNRPHTTMVQQQPPLFRPPSQQSILTSGRKMTRNSSAPVLGSSSSESIVEMRISSREAALTSQKDSMVRNKSSMATLVPFQSTPEEQSLQAASESGSLWSPKLEENTALAARRSMMRQSSMPIISPAISSTRQQSTFDSHQPWRGSTALPLAVQQSRLASWRTSAQQEIRDSVAPTDQIDRQRQVLWAGKRVIEGHRLEAEARRKARESAFDERMRRGDMLDAHREAMRKMQRLANQNLE